MMEEIGAQESQSSRSRSRSLRSKNKEEEEENSEKFDFDSDEFEINPTRRLKLITRGGPPVFSKRDNSNKNSTDAGSDKVAKKNKMDASDTKRLITSMILQIDECKLQSPKKNPEIYLSLIHI